MDCSMSGLPVHHQLLAFIQTHVHWVGDAIKPSHPLLSLLLLPSIFPSIRIFSNKSVFRMRWPNYWSLSFSISSSSEYSGLISFRMDWLDLLAVQGTLKSLLQHHRTTAKWYQQRLYTTEVMSREQVISELFLSFYWTKRLTYIVTWSISFILCN